MKVAKPHFIQSHPFLKWDWMQTSKKMTDWSYPYAAGGYIYKTEFFKKFVSRLSFDTPNRLEGNMYHERFKQNRPIMLSLNKTKILNISVNRVQEKIKNQYGTKYPQSESSLNQMILDGKIISTKNIYNYLNTCIFEEIKFKFV